VRLGKRPAGGGDRGDFSIQMADRSERENTGLLVSRAPSPPTTPRFNRNQHLIVCAACLCSGLAVLIIALIGAALHMAYQCKTPQFERMDIFAFPERTQTAAVTVVATADAVLRIDNSSLHNARVELRHFAVTKSRLKNKRQDIQMKDEELTATVEEEYGFPYLQGVWIGNLCSGTDITATIPGDGLAATNVSLTCSIQGHARLEGVGCSQVGHAQLASNQVVAVEGVWASWLEIFAGEGDVTISRICGGVHSQETRIDVSATGLVSVDLRDSKFAGGVTIEANYGKPKTDGISLDLVAPGDDQLPLVFFGQVHGGGASTLHIIGSDAALVNVFA